MKQRSWQLLSVALIATLLIGKLMPGSWKNAFIQQSPGELSLAAHILLFAAIAFAVPSAYPRIRPWHVLFLAFALTGLTESLQLFAVERSRTTW